MCHHSDRNRKDARLSWQQLITASGGWRCLYFSYQTAGGTAVAPSIAAAVPACVCACVCARMFVHLLVGCASMSRHTPGHMCGCPPFPPSLSLPPSPPAAPPPLLLPLAENMEGQTKFPDEAESFWADLLRPNRSRRAPQVFTFMLQLIYQQQLFPPKFITPLVMSISGLTMRDDGHFGFEPFANFQRVDI